jgi:hypothetical protein
MKLRSDSNLKLTCHHARITLLNSPLNTNSKTEPPFTEVSEMFVKLFIYLDATFRAKRRRECHSEVHPSVRTRRHRHRGDDAQGIA